MFVPLREILVVTGLFVAVATVVVLCVFVARRISRGRQCSGCGTMLERGERYCGTCGRRV